MIILKRPPLIRMAHYLLLLPFLPGLRPLLVDFRTADIAVYISGFLLILTLVIYGNHRPMVELHTKQLILHLNYRHKAELHRYCDIESYKKISSSRILLRSLGQQPVTLLLRPMDVDILIERLKTENIDAQ